MQHNGQEQATEVRKAHFLTRFNTFYQYDSWQVT